MNNFTPPPLMLKIGVPAPLPGQVPAVIKPAAGGKWFRQPAGFSRPASHDQVCKNCGHHFRDAFCSHCGQKRAQRLNLPHILHEALHVITHTDKGILPLIPAVLFRPGQLALDYVEGKRKRHFSIFQYLFLVVGLTTFIIAKGDLMETVATTFRTAPGAHPSAQALSVQTRVLGLIQTYFNFISFLMIPVITVFSWFFFRSKKYNYAENFVLQATIQAQIHTWSLLVIIPLLAFFGPAGQQWAIPLGFTILAGSNTLANRQFFKVPWPEAFGKGFFINLATNLVQVLLVFLALSALVLNKP
jgi:Protein of unknown function (DUF3667)